MRDALAIRWPDFLIVGTARAGTTSLHEFLGKHPDMCMPLQKEPCFFTFAGESPEFKDSRHRYTTDVESYAALFADCNKKLAGESSTPYLYFHQKSIANILRLVPQARDMRIIIVLRDPAERAYSQYMHNRRDLREPLSFEEAIEAEEERKRENWHFDFFYVNKGFYAAQVKDYMDHFQHVKVVFYDQLEKDPNGLLEDIYAFLGVTAPGEEEKIVRRNQSGEMKVKWLKRLMSNRKNPVLKGLRKLMGRNTKKRLRNWMKDKLLRYNLKKTDMLPATRKKLIERYREDIGRLEKLIGADLKHWLK